MGDLTAFAFALGINPTPSLLGDIDRKHSSLKLRGTETIWSSVFPAGEFEVEDDACEHGSGDVGFG
jgi:hypothetical protein